MDVRELVRSLGGVATYGELRAILTRRELAAAIAEGHILKMSRGRYVLPSAGKAARMAQIMSGTVAVASAARAHGWKLAREPEKPWIAVRRNRKVKPLWRQVAHIVYADREGGVTTPLETVLDCARHLPWPNALAVADSALREGAVGIVELIATANGTRGPGSTQCRRVALEATRLAASPLESVLRALALDVPGLDVVPQLPIELPRFTAHPDLADPRLRILIEGDTWLHHGATPEAFNRDVERYTLLVADGWTVLRFLWADAIDKPDYVSEVLARVVGRAETAAAEREEAAAARRTEARRVTAPA